MMTLVCLLSLYQTIVAPSAPATLNVLIFHHSLLQEKKGKKKKNLERKRLIMRELWKPKEEGARRRKVAPRGSHQ